MGKGYEQALPAQTQMTKRAFPSGTGEIQILILRSSSSGIRCRWGCGVTGTPKWGCPLPEIQKFHSCVYPRETRSHGIRMFFATLFRNSEKREMTPLSKTRHSYTAYPVSDLLVSDWKETKSCDRKEQKGGAAGCVQHTIWVHFSDWQNSTYCLCSHVEQKYKNMSGNDKQQKLTVVTFERGGRGMRSGRGTRGLQRKI